MPAPVTNAAEFATAVAEIIRDATNGNAARDKAKAALGWLKAQPQSTATVTIQAINPNP